MKSRKSTKLTYFTCLTATTIIPHNQYAAKLAKSNADKTLSVASPSSISVSAPPASTTSNTQRLYDDAAAMCRAKVEKIVRECRRINKKYRDPHFDLEADMKLGRRDCLESLCNLDFKLAKAPGYDFKPQSAKRVVDIFEKPELYIDAPTANDVKQGRDGDCWLMAALCTLSNKANLIENLCVAYDKDVRCMASSFIVTENGGQRLWTTL